VVRHPTKYLFKQQKNGRMIHSSQIGISSSRMESPLLTIAVPTYNRSRYLATFLAGAAPQIVGEDRVELLISDNASPDDTGELVQRYQSQGIPIRYVRNESNVGPDGNILQCFELASGKYVWICGDDDVIEPSGLGKLLSYLTSADEYDLISLHARGFTGEYSPQVATSPDKIKILKRSEDLARHVNVFFTFITGMIINKHRVSSFPHRPFAELVGTNLVQLSWTYSALEHHRRSLIVYTPLVATLANNTGGYALFKVFGTNLKRITDQWLSSPKVRSAIYRGTMQSFFPWFLVKSKKGSAFLAEDPHKILYPAFGNYLHYWVFDFPIIKLPRILGIGWFWMVKVVNKVDKTLGRPLLRGIGS
jgi:abequosyltransferase